MPKDKYLLREDGIIDPLAVEIAANGQRKVRLTRRERKMACAMILANAEPGLTESEIRHRVQDWLALPTYRHAIYLVGTCTGKRKRTAAHEQGEDYPLAA